MGSYVRVCFRKLFITCACFAVNRIWKKKIAACCGDISPLTNHPGSIDHPWSTHWQHQDTKPTKHIHIQTPFSFVVICFSKITPAKSARTRLGVLYMDSCNMLEKEVKLDGIPKKVINRRSPRWSSGWRACHWIQGSQVHTRPGRSKYRNTPTFGGYVKSSAPCRKILRHVKNPLRYYKDAS
jgi:hypothetical protein